MTTRNPSRCLELLEQRVKPTIVRRVLQIVILHPDVRREEARRIEWPPPQPAADFQRAPLSKSLPIMLVTGQSLLACGLRSMVHIRRLKGHAKISLVLEE